MLLLLSLGFGQQEEEPEIVTISSFDMADEPAPESEETANPPASASAPDEPTPTPDLPEPTTPAEAPLPSALPIPTATVPPPRPAPSPTPSPAPSSRIGAVVRSDRNYGPADTGSSRGEDSPVVGTAPDGTPLYGARWYREPQPDQLSGYLSTASSPGWGLIACKTAPDWRVENCVILDEYPSGSGIARATQAAAWQFQVRPPRRGGQYLVGSWVRIRIDYTQSQRRGNY